MQILLIALGILVGLILLIVLIGALLPKAHVASHEIRVSQSPAEVWAVVSDFAAWPRWWSELKQVERLADVDGRERWRESMKNGMTMTLETLEWRPPTRFVRKITDKNLPFGGTWTLEITPAGSAGGGGGGRGGSGGGGSLVRITEDGEVYNPLFRFMSKFVFGHEATIRACLTALERALAK